MDINVIGISAALATFMGIWMGHVLVRVIEFRARSILPPVIVFSILGILLLSCSFLANAKALSAALGILSMTTFWDAYEFFRQEKRVIKGHAPANPNNPRHQKILKTYPTSTTLDLLKRNPVGREVEPEEAARLVLTHEAIQ